VRFANPPSQVFEHLRRGVIDHAVEEGTQHADAEPATLLTRYTTKLWFGTVVTTERATIDPQQAITWEHVDGPLTGSTETFRLVAADDGRSTAVVYEGAIRARHPLFKGPLERLFVAPTVRRVSLGALEQARRDLAH
jgi:hypothetical protein